tara:strand:+ start:56 stop:526 length:471 start_codon:yes stop_codon:yes gene_type:complete
MHVSPVLPELDAHSFHCAEKERRPPSAIRAMHIDAPTMKAMERHMVRRCPKVGNGLRISRRRGIHDWDFKVNLCHFSQGRQLAKLCGKVNEEQRFSAAKSFRDAADLFLRDQPAPSNEAALSRSEKVSERQARHNPQRKSRAKHCARREAKRLVHD